MTEVAEFPPFPFWQDGWRVGPLPVAAWGSAFANPYPLPARWQGGPDDGGVREPTDLELACFVHLVAHEQARQQGHELMMLVDCLGLDDEVPSEAKTAAVAGLTLVPWCPRVAWHWDGENMPTDMRAKFDRR